MKAIPCGLVDCDTNADATAQTKLPWLMGLMLAVLILGNATASAAIFNYFPVSDGGLYSESGVHIGGYLLADGSYKADMHFQAFDVVPGSSVALSLGIYALPMHGKNVQIFAFNTPDAVISGADYNAGIQLGTLVLPDSYANFGQTITFDVTSFVNTANGPYWGFVLVSDGDTFNSLQYYVGQPEALIVTTVPEPTISGIFLTAIFVGAALRWRLAQLCRA